MDLLLKKFKKLGVDNAPGQEYFQDKNILDIRGPQLSGVPVDFSHGDVDAFKPLPGSLEKFIDGYYWGGHQAYTEYRGGISSRKEVSEVLSEYVNAQIDPEREIILTPGTQGALFLAMGSMIARGDKVAIVEPDYFANRKLAEFFEATIVPIHMNYFESDQKSGINLTELESSFKAGVKMFLFSNPNNPTGTIYSEKEVVSIVFLAKKYNVALIVDELYSRQIFDEKKYTHLCALQERPDNLITIIGPSKTESLSGFRLGVAFGTSEIIARMEKLQAIVSLRAAGYCQSVFKVWFHEPVGFMRERIRQHASIRDDLVRKLRAVSGIQVRSTDAGSYLFPTLPTLDVDITDFVKIVRKLADVTVTPGVEFGPQFIHSFRLNFSQNHEAALSAIDRLILIMERYRSK